MKGVRMVVNSIGYGIYDGFEGYNDPSEAEVLGLLETCRCSRY